ncbi:hypothetical protein CHUAL_006994 [Chamberlinius hualienensis]
MSVEMLFIVITLLASEFCLLIECSTEITNVNEPKVKISSGLVAGYTASSTKGKSYYGFNGIPYAKSPIRFRPPEPVKPWDGVLKATNDTIICPQINLMTNRYEGHEDCLILNVYTPQLVNETNRLLPVIAVIHGGGFIIGSSGQFFYGPQNMMDYPVVLVTFNYRLGILGFLSTEDEYAYGNYGLLDQVMALKWIQLNIDNFGGDPNRVTIYGGSAGSASVIYHLLSPLSSGLFHRAIAASGTATNPWAFKENPRKWAKMFANHLQCPNPNNTKEIVQCLSEKPAEQLVSEVLKIRTALYFPNDVVPVAEPKEGGEFLTENPHVLLKEGRITNKVPVILGITIDEGYSINLVLVNKLKSYGKKYFENEISTHLPLFSLIKSNLSLAVKEIIKEYVKIGDEIENKKTFEKTLFSIVGDATLSSGVSQTADQLSKAGLPTYTYVFDHLGAHCAAELMGGQCGKYSSHGDDAFLHFRIANFFPMTADDSIMSDIMNTLWTNFAAGSVLNLGDGKKWPLYDVDNQRHVELSMKPRIKNGPLLKKAIFWNEYLPAAINN